MKTLFTLLLTACITCAYCQADALDLSFGKAGFIKMVTDSAELFDNGRAAALQQDSKIIVSSKFSNHKRPELIRYMPDGTIGHTFGNNGIVAFDSFNVRDREGYTWTRSSKYGYFEAIAIQPDGKIVVASCFF